MDTSGILRFGTHDEFFVGALQRPGESPFPLLLPSAKDLPGTIEIASFFQGSGGPATLEVFELQIANGAFVLQADKLQYLRMSSERPGKCPACSSQLAVTVTKTGQTRLSCARAGCGYGRNLASVRF